MTSPSLRSSFESKTDQRIIIEYDDTTRAWNDLKHGNLTSKSTVRQSYRTSLAECTKSFILSHHGTFERGKTIDSFDVPPLVCQEPEIENQCSICRRYQGQIYPCRICGKVYHQQCIRDLGHIKSSHVMKMAMNSIGWSCPMCEDLRGVLSSTDLAEINTFIKSLNPQSCMTLDTYIKTRFHLTSPISPDADHFNGNMKQILYTFLNSIAEIPSNRLSPPDLYILEISLKLLRTSPVQLLRHLTSFELYRLSQLFLTLSAPDHQYITSDRFEHVFRSYLRTTMSDFPEENDGDLHLDALGYGLLGERAKSPRTWPQFLLDSVVLTLLNRYNHRSLADFVDRVISTARSTTPTTAEVLEQVDQQAVSQLIEHVLAKFGNSSVDTNRKKSSRGKK